MKSYKHEELWEVLWDAGNPCGTRNTRRQCEDMAAAALAYFREMVQNQEAVSARLDDKSRETEYLISKAELLRKIEEGK